MRQLGKLAVLAGVLALGGVAHAQESHKFDAKKLAAKYDVPVYPTKGPVVGNEVVESNDDTRHLQTAIWSVKGSEKDLKKALDFYKKALGDPKKETSDIGAPDKYTFKKQDPDESKTRHRVIVSFDKESKLVQMMIWVRTYESAADADD